jgi:ATP-dependent Lon protease
MTTAIASLGTGRKVRARVSMTGEVTLTGRVLPVGGIKEKVLAAQRAGIREVILPERNRKDVDEDVPPQVKEKVQFHFVSEVREALELALEPAPAAPSAPVKEAKPKKGDRKRAAGDAAKTELNGTSWPKGGRKRAGSGA